MLHHLVLLFVALTQLSALAAAPSVNREPLPARPVERASWAPKGWLLVRSTVQRRQTTALADQEWSALNEVTFGVARHLAVRVQGDWLDQGDGGLLHLPGFGVTVGLLRSEPMSRSLALEVMHHMPASAKGQQSEQTSVAMVGDVQWGGLLFRLRTLAQRRHKTPIHDRVQGQVSVLGQLGPLMLTGDVAISQSRAGAFGRHGLSAGAQLNRALSLTGGPVFTWSQVQEGSAPLINPGAGRGAQISVELAL